MFDILVSGIFDLSNVCLCPVAQSCLTLFVTPWTATLQAPLSLEFFRQKYWTGLPFPTLGVFLIQGITLVSSACPAWQADSLPIQPPGKPLIYLLYLPLDFNFLSYI